jgi:hypothetical protein
MPGPSGDPLAAAKPAALVCCLRNSQYKFVILTGAKRSGEPALSGVEGDLLFQ